MQILFSLVNNKNYFITQKKAVKLIVKIFFLLTNLFFFFRCDALTIDQEEALILKQFFQTLLLQSEGGYVLYDKKPICINGFMTIDAFTKETTQHQESVDLRQGAFLWKKILKSIAKSNQNKIIHIYNKNDSVAKKYLHLLFINRELFKKTVQINLPLFQSILGPSTTPDLLLAKLTDPEEIFHSVLKNNKVLIGIILGFGTQNSLYGGRMEMLQEHLLSNEKPPMKNPLLENEKIREFYKEVLLFHPPSTVHEMAKLEPSLSYSSLREEISDYAKKNGDLIRKIVAKSSLFYFR